MSINQNIFTLIFILFFNLTFFKFIYADTANVKRVLVSPRESKIVKWPEASYKRIYITENMAPLPFKKFPYKPIYAGEISDEIIDESQKIKESAINQLASRFDLSMQKQKDRKKNQQELLVFNEEKNKKFFEYFKSVNRVKSKPADFRGFHYNYSEYLQNFKMITRR